MVIIPTRIELVLSILYVPTTYYNIIQHKYNDDQARIKSYIGAQRPIVGCEPKWIKTRISYPYNKDFKIVVPSHNFI